MCASRRPAGRAASLRAARCSDRYNYRRRWLHESAISADLLSRILRLLHARTSSCASKAAATFPIAAAATFRPPSATRSAVTAFATVATPFTSTAVAAPVSSASSSATTPPPFDVDACVNHDYLTGPFEGLSALDIMRPASHQGGFAFVKESSTVGTPTTHAKDFGALYPPEPLQAGVIEATNQGAHLLSSSYTSPRERASSVRCVLRTERVFVDLRYVRVAYQVCRP